MSVTLAVDGNNDLFVDSSGNIGLAYDIQATLQSAAQAAKSQFGEMQYHVDRGIPNMQTIWSGHANIAQFEAALRRELLKVTNVIAITALTAKIVGETVTYSATIKTNFGDTVING